jgi:hypothetical protein
MKKELLTSSFRRATLLFFLEPIMVRKIILACLFLLHPSSFILYLFLVPACCLADTSVGIPYATPFTAPVLVGSKTASGLAVVGDCATGAAPTMMVFYAQPDGSVACLSYTLTRQSMPIPNPTPNPTPNPPPVPGLLHVLVVYDNTTLGTLPAAQAAIIDSMAVRDYLKGHCSKSSGTANFRFFDQAADLSKEPPDWQAVAARPRSGLPWLVVANGKDTFEGLLPASVEETLALLQKYGGP